MSCVPDAKRAQPAPDLGRCLRLGFLWQPRPQETAGGVVAQSYNLTGLFSRRRTELAASSDDTRAKFRRTDKHPRQAPATYTEDKLQQRTPKTTTPGAPLRRAAKRRPPNCAHEQAPRRGGGRPGGGASGVAAKACARHTGGAEPGGQWRNCAHKAHKDDRTRARRAAARHCGRALQLRRGQLRMLRVLARDIGAATTQAVPAAVASRNPPSSGTTATAAFSETPGAHPPPEAPERRNPQARPKPATASRPRTPSSAHR